MQLDGRPEFRDHRDSRAEFVHHLNVWARVHNELHAGETGFVPIPMLTVEEVEAMERRAKACSSQT